MSRVAACTGLATVVALLGCSSADHGKAVSHDERAVAAGDAGARDAAADALARAKPDATRSKPDAAAPREASDARAEEADLPTATTLSIAPLTMVPAFDVGTHDYYVRCAAGTNRLTVAMTAAPGSTIGLLSPEATVAGVRATKRLEVQEGAAVVVGVTTAGATDEYWVRCLPHDFPVMAMTAQPDAGAPPPGYYLIGDVIQASGEGGYAMAVDVHGVPLWYHTTETGQGGVNVDNLASGTITFVANQSLTYANVSGQYEIHDLLTKTTSYLTTVDGPLDMHDLRVLPNGDYLVMTDPIARGVDLTGLQAFGPEEDVVGCRIEELTPAGQLVWSWDINDHFDAVKDSTWPQTYPVDGKTVVDPYHCNSLDVASNGDILVSARHMDSVFMVQRSSGKVLWKMGGATYATDPGAVYIAVVDDPLTGFRRQHDVRLQAESELSMFDDQTEATGPARAVIYSYSVITAKATPVWSYAGTTTSLAMGSFRILSDGSRVIGWGVGWGPPYRAFTEVNAQGDDLLDFDFPDGDATYRAIKVSTDAIDVSVLRATAGLD